jgi:hypothetical protein
VPEKLVMAGRDDGRNQGLEKGGYVFTAAGATAKLFSGNTHVFSNRLVGVFIAGNDLNDHLNSLPTYLSR